MVSSNAKNVDEYLQELEPSRRTALTTLRALIRETVPRAEVSMEYRMPTYAVEGRMLCALASQKHHLSLYMDPTLVEKHSHSFSALDVGKSCIRFKHIADLPLDTVRQILEESL